jgi:hypothetical protein
MAIMIREDLGYEGLQVDWNFSSKPGAKPELSESVQNTPIAQDSLMVEIEGIHEGPTRNYTWYMTEGLQSSIPTWTKPYLRPLIMHHNEKDGKIIGRIRDVIYQDTKTLSGTGALVFTANVPDKEGKEGIENGTLKTVSIGAIVHDCRCSICGANIAEMSQEELENHEHVRGGIYIIDGVQKTCYWQIYRMEAKELSYVIVPSDIYAQTTKIYKPSKTAMSVAANFNNEGVLNLSEAAKLENQESTVIDEKQPVGDPTPAPVPTVEDTDKLKQEIEDLKGKLKAAEEGKTEAEGKVEDLTAKATKAEQDLTDTKVLLEQATKNIEQAKKDLILKEADLINANTLRESLEEKVINLNKHVKESLIDSVITLRESLGKPVQAKEDLEARSEDSLKDAIKDLKEELSNPAAATTITQTVNPSVVESAKDFNSDVKKDEKASNINLQEGLEKVFENIFTDKTRSNFY